MDFFKKRGVYRKVLRIEAIKKGAKIIKLKWIDTNKGDTENPNYRSRLVGMEFSSGADPENFAATPPLEALRVVVSHAGTVKNGKARKFMINDVARAYFNAKIDRDLYVELPAEDRDDKDDMVGKLELCLYGIQDAARCWQEMLTEHLLSIGFVRGIGHPCVFFHADWDVKAAVHGDDYASAGPKEGILKLKKALEDKFDIRNTHILGHEPGDEVEGKVLNRVVRAGKHGWEFEADPRHAELLIKQFDMEGTKGVVSPGSDQGEAESEEEDNDAITSKKNLKEFRSAAARTNYLAQDRPDIAFAAKEVCRDMACPTMRSWKKLKRIVRYLVRRPRVVNFYDFQDHVEELTVFADANWAGCKTTRKSTSGGCVLRGGHLLRFWSKTQATIAQSSGESELLGAVRGGVEALGAMTLLKDFGERCTAKLVLDASAALGILQRRGVGKIRHLDVGALWLQEKEAQRRLKIEKVKGEKNPADLGTKHLGEEVLTRHMHAMNLDFAEGRASTATKLLSVVERSRRPGLPRDWKGSAQEDGWTLNASSEWQKTFKNARALRARDPSGPEWRRVTRYTASDEKTGETFLALDVHDVREDDRRLHTILSRPCDLKVVLEVLPEERCESYAASDDPKTDLRGGDPLWAPPYDDLHKTRTGSDHSRPGMITSPCGLAHPEVGPKFQEMAKGVHVGRTFSEAIDMDVDHGGRGSSASRTPRRALIARAEPTTFVGKAIGECNADLKTESDPAEILKQQRDELVGNLKMLSALREHTNVKHILREIDEGMKVPKEARQAASMNHDGTVDVAEVYSPPRITDVAAEMGISKGWALDLTQVDEDDGRPWDFSVNAKRIKAKEKVKAKDEATDRHEGPGQG